MTDNEPPRRLCLTPEECLQAGWDDGVALGEKMPPHLMDRMVALHAPHLVPKTEDQNPAA